MEESSVFLSSLVNSPIAMLLWIFLGIREDPKGKEKVLVGFWYILVLSSPVAKKLGDLYMMRSKKLQGWEPTSAVNLILSHVLLRSLRNTLNPSRDWDQTLKISFMYRTHRSDLSSRFSINDSSKSPMSLVAGAGASLVLIVIPCNWVNICPSNWNTLFLRTNLRRSK